MAEAARESGVFILFRRNTAREGEQHPSRLTLLGGDTLRIPYRLV
jgi:hypothetical protein